MPSPWFAHEDGSYIPLEDGRKFRTENPLGYDPPAGVMKGVGFITDSTITADVDLLNVSWYYDWASFSTPVPEVVVPGYEYVPMMWGDWENDIRWGVGALGGDPASSVSVDTIHLLGFNEPNISDQANMTVARALELWPELEATGLRLGSPSPTADGLAWLASFMAGSGGYVPRVDFLCLHWYPEYNGGFGTLAAFLDHVHGLYPTLPIWLTEVGELVGGVSANDALIPTVFDTCVDRPWVERVAWYVAREGGGWTGTGLITTGGALNAAGTTYAALDPIVVPEEEPPPEEYPYFVGFSESLAWNMSTSMVPGLLENDVVFAIITAEQMTAGWAVDLADDWHRVLETPNPNGAGNFFQGGIYWTRVDSTGVVATNWSATSGNIAYVAYRRCRTEGNPFDRVSIAMGGDIDGANRIPSFDVPNAHSTLLGLYGWWDWGDGAVGTFANERFDSGEAHYAADTTDVPVGPTGLMNVVHPDTAFVAAMFALAPEGAPQARPDIRGAWTSDNTNATQVLSLTGTGAQAGDKVLFVISTEEVGGPDLVWTSVPTGVTRVGGGDVSLPQITDPSTIDMTYYAFETVLKNGFSNTWTFVADDAPYCNLNVVVFQGPNTYLQYETGGYASALSTVERIPAVTVDEGTSSIAFVCSYESGRLTGAPIGYSEAADGAYLAEETRSETNTGRSAANWITMVLEASLVPWPEPPSFIGDDFNRASFGAAWGGPYFGSASIVSNQASIGCRKLIYQTPMESVEHWASLEVDGAGTAEAMPASICGPNTGNSAVGQGYDMYLFLFSGNGYGFVQRNGSGVGGDFELTYPHSGMQRFTLSRIGSVISIYVNNEVTPQWTWTDPSPLSGLYVAIGTNNDGGTFLADNFRCGIGVPIRD